MKGTTLTELLAAWKNHKDIISTRAHAAAGYPDRKRWREIMAARKRRLNRSRIFIRASVVARVLENHELFQYMNEIRGSNGLPKMIHTFGNSGTAKSQREASNAGN